jgi:hypothetical protein
VEQRWRRLLVSKPQSSPVVGTRLRAVAGVRVQGIRKTLCDVGAQAKTVTSLLILPSVLCLVHFFTYRLSEMN